MRYILLKTSFLLTRKYLASICGKLMPIHHKPNKPVVYRCRMTEDEFNQAIKFLNNE